MIQTLNNKKFTLENKDELVIPEYETDETLIEVEYSSEYNDFLKRVEFLNIRKERYTLELNQQDDNSITFTIPKEMALRGELKMQFIAYLLDDVNTLVPFHIVVVTISYQVWCYFSCNAILRVKQNKTKSVKQEITKRIF